MAKVGIDVFTKAQFESELPVHKDTGKTLWHEEGFVNGEHCYSVRVNEFVWIAVRSSVKSDGKSAATGEDSIRVWLVDGDERPLGNKLRAYITRLPGWGGRLRESCRELWSRASNLEMCPTCNKPMGVFAQKKKGPNKGRLFTKCFDHGHFRWLDFEAQGITPQKQIVPLTVEEMKDRTSGIGLVKYKVEFIRTWIETDDDFLVSALLFVYDRQTYGEQVMGTTVEHNKVGFSGVDAELLTSFSKQFKEKKFLSFKQLTLARNKVKKYAKQIERELR